MLGSWSLKATRWEPNLGTFQLRVPELKLTLRLAYSDQGFSIEPESECCHATLTKRTAGVKGAWECAPCGQLDPRLDLHQWIRRTVFSSVFTPEEPLRGWLESLLSWQELDPLIVTLYADEVAHLIEEFSGGADIWDEPHPIWWWQPESREWLQAKADRFMEEKGAACTSNS